MTEEEEKKEYIMARYERKTAPTLVIKGVPKRTYDLFIDVANMEDFCEDWRLAFVHIMDVYSGVITTGADQLYAELNPKIEELSRKVSALEEKPEEDKKRTMIDGSVRS